MDDDNDAPPVAIAREEVKEESDDEEEPTPEAEAAQTVQPPVASPKAEARPSASSAPKKESSRAGRITKEQWETMLIDSQFEETYITNHHLQDWSGRVPVHRSGGRAWQNRPWCCDRRPSL